MKMNEIRTAVERLCEVGTDANLSMDDKMDIFLNEPGVADLITQMTRAINVSILNMMAGLISPKNTNTFYRGKCSFPLSPTTIEMISEALNSNGRDDSGDEVLSATLAMFRDGFITITKTPLRDVEGDVIFNVRCTPKVLKKYRHMLDR